MTIILISTTTTLRLKTPVFDRGNRSVQQDNNSVSHDSVYRDLLKVRC